MKNHLKQSRKFLLGIALGVVIMLFVRAKEADPFFEISKNLEVFTTLFKELNTYYVDPIEPGKMMKTGIDAMLNDLDPYTNYITEEEIEDYRFQTTGKYGGIGSTMRMKDGMIVIDQPYENSPVLKAGLKSGDIILEIEGKSTKGKSVDDVSKFIKGSAGTPLKLKIKDAITGLESSKTVVREEINISSVPYAGMIGENNEIAYVKLSQFTDRCASMVRSSFDSMKKANPTMKGVVLDLRSNPGGLLDEAVAMCNIFLNTNQHVLSTKGKAAEWDKEYKTLGTPWDTEIPVTVLINRGSASASEIVAGTMQDLDRGVVIGQRSFGKGLVQTTRSLAFNSKLKVTTAKYYTPSGRCIQALDYSHRNEDGSVGEIPDSIKTTYKTKNGRSVKDGGGVEPDVKMEVKSDLKIATTLLNKAYAFDYANLYVSKHPTIDSAANFSLTENDYADFLKWIEGKDVAYQTEAEKLLSEFKKIAEKENYFKGVEKDYEALKKSLSGDKKQDLVKNKKEIMRLLQDEIVTRYYFIKGRIQNQLKSDEEIAEAIRLINNSSKYASILGSK
jgi:carboxyl-terminal processing protease